MKPDGHKVTKDDYPLLFGALTRLEKVTQGVVYFTTLRIDPKAERRGHTQLWVSAWAPDFTEGSFWLPSDCFLMIPPANWKCEL